MRARIELHRFDPELILEICKTCARVNIIGALFIGTIGEQQTVTLPDGTVEVRTEVSEVE